VLLDKRKTSEAQRLDHLDDKNMKFLYRWNPAQIYLQGLICIHFKTNGSHGYKAC